MSYKINREEPWQTFWKKVFDYIVQHRLPFYDVLFFVLYTPSVFHLKDHKLLKFLRRIASYYNILDQDPFAWALFYVARIYDRYSEFRHLPLKNYEGLERLYALIMRDFRQAQPCTFEEALQDQGNAASLEMMKRSWFIIDSIFKDANVEQVAEIIKVSQKEEEQIYDTPPDAHVVVRDYLAGISVQHFDDYLKRFAGEVTEEDMIKAIHAEKQGDKIVMPAKLAKLYFALLHYYSHAEADYKEIMDELNKCKQENEALRNIYRGDLKMILEENENLRRQLAEAEPSIKKIKIDESGKIERLKQEYEAQIEELKEEIEALRDMLSIIEKEEEETKLEPLSEPVYIAYFGLENKQLFDYLASFNIFVKLFSPISPPDVLPSLPIVFNVDVASHKVWWTIKDKKPLLVSGSNRFLLTKRILAWLKSD